MKNIGNRRERVRLVGFGDDDDTEETSEWLVMVEETGEFIYSNHIMWNFERLRQLITDTFVLNEFDEEYPSSSQLHILTNTDTSILENESTFLTSQI
jgi:hypothetical protein